MATCSYVYPIREHSKRSGEQCGRKITLQDPQNAFCSAHYKTVVARTLQKEEQAIIDQREQDSNALRAQIVELKERMEELLTLAAKI